MKIITTGLHALYDQYSNSENRLTHALLQTISSSEWLLSNFLKELIDNKISLSGMTLEISTQKEPFSYGDSDPEEVGSIPDAWIIDQTLKLGIAIEVKDRKNYLSLNQLDNHAKKVKGFKEPYLLIITPDFKKPEKVAIFENTQGGSLTVIWRSWDEIYRWLRHNITFKSLQIKTKEDFLVHSMIDFLEGRREVLGFQGINFRKGFDVSEAKLILNAEMEEVEPFIKSLYKTLGRRRPAITTFSKESVWDCFGSDDGFTGDLHLTFGMNEKCHEISLTVPNSAKKPWLRLKTLFSEDCENQLYAILSDLRINIPHLFIEFNQRHFVARRFGIRDGFMEFNIDTLGSPFRNKKSLVKEFPGWLNAIRSAILNKKGINGQVMFKSRFYFNETEGIDKPQFIETANDAIRAFKPLYDFLKENE